MQDEINLFVSDFLVKFRSVIVIFSDGRMYMMLVKEALGFVIRFEGV